MTQPSRAYPTSKHAPWEPCDCVNPATGRKHRELPGDPPYHCAAAAIAQLKGNEAT